MIASLILISSFSFFIFSVFSFDFETYDDLNAFEGKPVVALWRGTHFSPTHFPTDEAQRKYMAAHGLQVPIYCAAAHRAANVSYTQPLSTQRRSALNDSVATIQRVFKEMEHRPAITINRDHFSNHRHAFQQIYSNSTGFIAALNQPELPATYKKYRRVVEGLPQGNPLLSFTTDVKHAGKYAYGLKDYGHIEGMGALYDAEGRRQHTYVGYVQGIFLTNLMARECMPYDVVAHHEADNIKISSHYSNNILSEHEVSMVGKMPGKGVVVTLPVEIPDLSTPYPGEYRTKFGLSKRKYDNIRNIVTDAQTPTEEKEARITKMLNEILMPPQEDSALTYKHTLYYQAQAVLDQMCEGMDHVKGIIGLDGRVYDAERYA